MAQRSCGRAVIDPVIRAMRGAAAVRLATSPAQYPAGSGVGVSVLLPQAEGFEGFCLASAVAVVGQAAVTQLGCSPHPLLEGHTAVEAVAADTQRDDPRITKISTHFQDLHAEIGEDCEHGPPPFSDAVMAAVVGIALHLQKARAELHRRVYGS